MAQTGIPINHEPFTVMTAITLSDSTDLAKPCDAFFVGTSGNLVANDTQGNSITLKGLIAGRIYPFRLARFKSTSTTAADLVALYRN